ncbi:macrophage migration inhibitory factor [Dorcoceras hygrometricum]|uniref:Macrophage migration inhibitory factor n=1 Tax=Dorcoceras hygrometricum TaxID=472368 RepID=A0A2Z7A9Y6_9LAMI|nr:macrophage migration inhibitory factor [Dorcoceras hygrometricum]
MPCLDISTNVDLDGVDTDSIFSELTRAVSQIVGIPEKFVMILMKGSVALTFGGNKEPAALAEIVSIGAIDSQIKRKLIATIGSILQKTLSIPTTRFVLKVFTVTSTKNASRL